MPVFSGDKLSSLQEVAEVENALIDGYPATVLKGNSTQTSALRAAADRLLVDPQSLRGRIGTPTRPGRIFKRYAFTVDWKIPPISKPPEFKPIEAEPEGITASVKDRTIIGLRDEVTRLTQEMKAAHRSGNVESVLKDILGGIVEAPKNIPPWIASPVRSSHTSDKQEIPVTVWADWHLGEVVERDEMSGANEYNLEVAERRINRLIDTTIRLCRDYHTGKYPGIVINLAGDFVSGGIHPELKATDEEEVIPSVLKAVDWLSASIEKMLDHFKVLYVPCAAGNHGRNTAKPEFKRYYKKNFDWLIYQILARKYAGNTSVTFDIRPSNDCLYKVYNTRYLLTHGDMLGVKGGDGIIGAIGPIMRGEVKRSGQASSIGQAFDTLVMGHWHQNLWLPRAIVSNCLKGFDEYARLQLGAKYTPPSQPLWFVHPDHGMTAQRNIYVDEPLKTPPQPWLSVYRG